jgi:hypothetical protein
VPVVLLRLTDARLRRVGIRLFSGVQSTVTVPEGLIRPHRRWRVVLVIAETERLNWDGSALDAEPGELSVIAIARLRGSGRPSTTDDRILVAEPHALYPPLPIPELVQGLPHARRPALRQAMQEVGAELDDPLGANVLSSLIAARPEVAEVIERLTRFTNEPIDGEEAPVLAMERDAVHLALTIAGFDFDDTGRWDADAAGGYLARLAYPPREESLSGYDATRFPGWQPLPGSRPDWRLFTDGRHHLRVGNVNATPLERVLGVDLIYRHLGSGTFVLVQYKKMSRTGAGSWGYRPDAQLREELERMRKVDSWLVQPDKDPATWRLFPKGCFVKLVRPPDTFDPTSDRLLSGIYLPVAYLEELLAHGAALGQRGGQWLGYDTVDRYLTTGLFVALVREGWIGTRDITTRAIELVVEAAVGQGRSVVIAEEAGEQTGRERRGRRRPY